MKILKSPYKFHLAHTNLTRNTVSLTGSSVFFEREICLMVRAIFIISNFLTWKLVI